MLPENIYPKLGYQEPYTILLIIIRINGRCRREMTNMHESFFTVAKHFSHHRPLIQSLFRSSPVFRETCMNYHKCGIIINAWEADNDNRWTVPLGGGFGRLFRIGQLPVNTQLQAFYNVEKPEVLGPDWTLRFQIQFLLPKW
jgi:hypothetical protein